MTALVKFIAAILGLIAVAASAQAADMPGNWPPPYQHKPVQTFSEMMSGWYIRGDIGYRFNKVGSAVGSNSAQPITSSTIDNVFTGGAGVGWKYQWFRTDLTIDYGSGAKFLGNAPATSSYYSMKIDAVTALANVYFDLGSWSGFTPYVGAGLGASWVRTADYAVASLGPTVAISTRPTWNLSWAVMGGVSYQLLPNIVLDMGYRYLAIGDALSGFEPPANLAYTSVKKISAQDVRLGVRFLLD
jgi:opacity protein-like surface antigen